MQTRFQTSQRGVSARGRCLTHGILFLLECSQGSSHGVPGHSCRPLLLALAAVEIGLGKVPCSLAGATNALSIAADYFLGGEGAYVGGGEVHGRATSSAGCGGGGLGPGTGSGVVRVVVSVLVPEVPLAVVDVLEEIYQVSQGVGEGVADQVLVERSLRPP